MSHKAIFAAVLMLCQAVLMLFPFSASAGKGTDAPAKGKCIIKGIVLDLKKNTPIEFANVALMSKADSSVISGTYSGKSGEFILANITEGKYALRVSYMGYKTHEVAEIEIKENSAEMDLGRVDLEQTLVKVEGVTVAGDRPAEEFHLDKKVINVSQSLHASGGTALDVLQEQPSVKVDADGTVTLRGSSNFTVLVNGRPGVFQGADALRQIPANIIENIEIITNPPARYEAEGSAGIININTKVHTAPSVNGIMNAGTGSRNRYNGDATFNYNRSSYTFMGSFDYRRSTLFQIQDIERRSFLESGEFLNNSLLRRIDKRNQYTIRYGFDYKPDERNLLSLTGNGGKVGMVRDMSLNIHDRSDIHNDYIRTENGLDLDATFFNSALYYRFKPRPEGNEMTAEISYTNVHMPYAQLTNEFRTDSVFSNYLPEPGTQEMTTDIRRNEGYAKLNYSHPFGEQRTFECGLQSNFSFRDMNIRNLAYDWSAGKWLADAALTNRYDFMNNVYAGFASYSDMLYGFNYQIGLRTEYMDRLLRQKTAEDDYKYGKLDIFPSMSVSRKIGDHQLQFSYSRRINRPPDFLLNPFPYYTDRYLTSSGNPRLLPEYTNSFELNYQKTFAGIFFSAQTYLRASTGSFLQEISVDTTGRMVAVFDNFAKTSNAGAEITLSWSPQKWLRIDPNVNFFNYNMKGTSLSEKIESNSFTWTSRLTSTFTLTPGTRLQATGIYQGKQLFPQGEVDPVFNLNVSARQDFFNKALTLTLQGQNLMSTSNIDIGSKGPNFVNTFLVKTEVPVISLSLSYNFNNFKRPERQGERVDINVGM